MLAALFMEVLQISVTSGIIILMLVAFSSKLNDIFEAKWKFWVWLLLAARLFIPVGFAVPQAPVRLSISDVPVPGLPQRQITQMALDRSGTQALTMIELAALIWISGIILFLLYHMIVYKVCKKRILRWSHTPKDARLLSSVNDMRFAAGISKTIPLLISSKISSPMIIGFFNSYLLLPTEDYTSSELYYIVKHELIHIKRRDVWYKLLLLCVNAVHWFNPVIYLMLREAGKDLELSCDDAVIKGLPFTAKKEYGDTILKSVHRQRFQNTMLTVCFYGGANVIKARFRNILNRSGKRSGFLPGVTAVLCVFLAGSLIACERSGLAESNMTRLEYYYITTGLEFPANDIFLSLSTARKENVKAAASRYIENVAREAGLTLPDYFDQYFFIRKLNDENELEQLKTQGLADNRSQLHAVL